MQTTKKDWAGDVFVRINGDPVICIDTGEWEEGYQVGFVKTPEAILMQYTGLKDKNGKEIYESDILREKIGGKVFKYAVIWNEECAAFGDDDGQHFNDDIDAKKVEVIGNIYENPELLK